MKRQSIDTIDRYAQSVKCCLRIEFRYNSEQYVICSFFKKKKLDQIIYITYKATIEINYQIHCWAQSSLTIQSILCKANINTHTHIIDARKHSLYVYNTII